MTGHRLDEEVIFHTARQIDKLDARDAFLDQICSGDGQLRERVEALLAACDDERLRSQQFAPDVATTADEPPLAERPGQQIGPYRLMEEIGEGGFGKVFVAEQQKPMRRKVALKVIKPGMDSREIIARFEAERQALALMDHPNIARVLDAGTTDSGRPYFVMELVKGMPIVAYCDQHQLSTRERLDLFIAVCRAVQHAHSKGVIHRDLKPSNVMVAPHDGKPVVKVIDFGIAKAIGQQLTDKTIYTRLHQLIGSPLYMSPEQAEINALDVDTRSDVYSLGVLLYELLTGTTPFDRQRFATAAFDEIRRIIREEDPPKPSTRLSSLGETLSEVSARRKTEPTKLSSEVSGDLDWIVMKCLEKDRTRRYETATSLAADVVRFLSQQPIEARPPSTGYKLRKFARRNRVLLATGTTIAIVLIVASVISTWLALWAMQQRDALRAAVDSHRDAIFAEGLQDLFSGNTRQGEEAIHVLHQLEATEEELSLRGVKFNSQGEFGKTIELIEPALRAYPDSVMLNSILTMGYSGAGSIDEWLERCAFLDGLEPKTAEEKLLAAYSAYYISDPLHALDLLDQSWNQRRIPMTMLARARTSVEASLQTGNLAYLDKTLADLTAAMHFMGAEGIGEVEAFMLSSLAFQRLQGESGWEAMRFKFGAIAEALAKRVRDREAPSPVNLVCLGRYQYPHSPEKSLATLREIDPSRQSSFFVLYRMALEFELETDFSTSDIEEGKGLYTDYCLGILYAAERNNAKATTLARRISEEYKSTDATFCSALILDLANEPEQATALVQDMVAKWQTRPLDKWSLWTVENLLQFYLDRDAQSLLDRATQSEYPCRWLTFAHGAIGHYYLGKGQNERAADHFQHVLDQRTPQFGHYPWSRGFLRRMRQGWCIRGEPLAFERADDGV